MRSVLVAVCLLAIAGCGKSAKSELPPGVVLLRGSGATFPAPLYKKWIAAYEHTAGDVQIEYEAVGSSQGIEDFMAGKVDFAGSDKALTDGQIAKVERGVLLVPTTAGMVTLAYNAEGLPPKLQLKRDVYVDIFLGKITNWNDPKIAESNPDFEFPNLAIALVVRHDGSGTTFAFTNHLSAISTSWKAGPGVGTKVVFPPSAFQENGNVDVAGAIKRTPGAIGYVEYGLASRLGLPLAWLENKAGRFIRPDLAAALAGLGSVQVPDNFRAFITDPEGGEAYPIVTYSWLLTYKKQVDSKQAAACKRFLLWCVTEGQAVNASLGFIPLPASLAKDVIEALHKLPPQE